MYATAVMIAVALGAGYFAGYISCENEFKEYQLKLSTLTTAMERDFRARENEYQTTISNLSSEIAANAQAYKDKLNSITSDSNNRLQLSNERAERYRKQVQSCSGESKRLAEHAANLDRKLTEGIGLVEELSTIIKLRDEQLEYLIKVRQADRELVNGN